MLADWQLPKGVSRATWDYVQSSQVAQGYDARLIDSLLSAVDLEFARQVFKRPGRLIDLGCGTGRLLIDFAWRGFRVLGVDLSDEMLRIAVAKTTAAHVQVDLLKANIVELDALADGTFEYAACLFSTLGMIEGAAQQQRVAANVYRLLKPGGRFLLHVHNRWFNVWDKAGRKWLAADVVRSIFGRSCVGDRMMPAHQGLAGLTLHHFTWHEAKCLLRSVGFHVEEIHPVSLRSDGRLRCPWWFGRLRAYGYLLSARK
jgi:SAM-dependent methyltransferase